jgi:DnaB-like helicase C terminal domain
VIIFPKTGNGNIVMAINRQRETPRSRSKRSCSPSENAACCLEGVPNNGVPDDKAVDQMSAVMGRRGAIGGITTGLKTLDNLADSLHRRQFVLKGGRPGMGKSGLMQSCALKTAVRMLVFKALASERRAEPQR